MEEAGLASEGEESTAHAAAAAPAVIDERSPAPAEFASALTSALAPSLTRATERPAMGDAIAAAAETIGTPEGAEAALRYFDDALGHVAKRLEEAEREEWSTYSYVYTAHPGKHMHALGVSHPKVRTVVQGLNARISRFWSERLQGLDATLLVTADHGHITVPSEKMIALPHHLLDCLEYANGEASPRNTEANAPRCGTSHLSPLISLSISQHLSLSTSQTLTGCFSLPLLTTRLSSAGVLLAQSASTVLAATPTFTAARAGRPTSPSASAPTPF